MIAAIEFKIDDKREAILYLAGSYNYIDWNSGGKTKLGDDIRAFSYKQGQKGVPAIVIQEGVDGEYVLRLIETKRYILKVQGSADIVLPQFQNENNKFLKIDKDRDSITFQFVNYLGRSRMVFPTKGMPKRLFFEVVPDKMDYESDYIGLTEALAHECAGLLLDYLGATSNRYSLSDENSESLLEQFVFLRQFCYGQNIQGIFEAIKRNPDRALVQEEEFEMVGRGKPSKKFYTNPFGFAKGWRKNDDSAIGKSFYMPQTVAITRKHDSVDTPANRFIKYAFNKFNMICIELIEKLGKNGNDAQTECYREAKSMHRMLEEITRDSFFYDIGTLDIMPQNNQVLQKREGYSQIFSAYSMIDLALQLDWKGKDDIYEGESKNVALLYEYWLFFELYKIICSIEGCELVYTKDDPFLTIEDGITISLEQGRKSCQSFEMKKAGLKINLYYNRSFSPRAFQTTVYEGSYSRPFRPDYTLAVYPTDYTKGKDNGEEDAVRNGAVSYIHFDAKYRITDMTSFIGKGDDSIEEELADDKIGSVVNTYKRGDLLKMHTYNDAIRRTIGSYVLYPGSGNGGNKNSVAFNLYDEILPGIGAFAIRPSIDEAGENELKEFIKRLLKTKEAESSRLNRMKYYTEMVLKEPALHIDKDSEENIKIKPEEKNDAPCVIGYIRADSDEDYYYYLKGHHLLEEGKQFLFYFYAIKGTNVYSHHPDVFKTSNFRFYINHPNRTGTYELEPIWGNIISNELVSRNELVRRLNMQGYTTSEEKHDADFYYVLTVQVENTKCIVQNIAVSSVNAQRGNDTFSPHSPKIVGI